MAVDSTILDAFFEECEDLLAALTDGLSEMQDGQADDETVNAVFRAVHSIKGAAGAFAMDDLVSFAHAFESVLDAVRGGTLPAEGALLPILQRAGDILADLVDAAREERPVERDKIDPMIADLKSFLPDAPVAEEDFSFDAVILDFGTSNTVTYQCKFQPTAEFYATGNDPLLVINALAELGPVSVTCDLSGLPASEETFDFTHGYLTWTVAVEDQTNDLAIREVFEFVEDICDLEVSEVIPDEETTETDAQLLPEFSTNSADPDEPSDLADETALETVSKTSSKADRAPKKSSTSLRVDPERVDRLINAVGELIINQSVISQRLQEAGLASSSDLFADLDDYKLLAREIQEGVMAIRAQPVKPLFQRMLRIAREAADATGKKVILQTVGEGTEVDKIVVERLADPLTHMIRNAIDHGIETSEDRLRAGKSESGQLKLCASQRSGSILIEIIDDGAGLNRPKILEIAVRKGLIAAEAQLSEQEIDHLLFAPGFSTATTVTNLSGRGVGMDVVKTAITELGGKIAISSVAGKGTTFSITLPLTLAVMDGMVINVEGQTMVVPIASILETIRPASADLAKMGLSNDLLRIRGEYVPIIDLANRLGSGRGQKDLTERVLLLIQTQTQTQCALAVDDIFDQRQVVVKSMQANYGEIQGISGATILGDGKVALIIDPESIANMPQTAPILPALPTKELSYVQ